MGLLFEEEFQHQINAFISDRRQNKVVGSFDIAIQTVLLLRKLVGGTKWSDEKELIESIKSVATQITDDTLEISSGNMIRRILKLVREEYDELAGKKSDGNGSESLPTSKFTQPIHINLKSAVIDSINEVISELETCRDNIATQALEHIHSNEVIMTYGNSRTVEKFLKNAARKRKFTVIVAECAPYYEGQKLAKSLAESGIETTVISDSAIFAIMSRVNKVIIGTNAVMADGGLKAISGTHAMALAAKHHSVPLIVCTGLFKLSPKFVCSYDLNLINQFHSPSDVIKLKDGSTLSKVEVINPLFDYIEADLVNLFITDVGGNVPSYLYRLLSEMYHQEDYELF
ncbi:translation initiation factor eIF2B subunit beta [Hydra vulgaris]|nr:translation initiation factor eIF-2B subunit beta [Hydra vulgaris]